MLYEVAFNVVAALVMLRWRRRLVVPGDLLRLYLLAAFTFRFLVEFVRGNEIQPWGLSGPQTVLVPLLAIVVVVLIRQARSGAYAVPAPPPSRVGAWVGS
jgi:prolipoprotein diacylglyceryltransferase